MLKSQTFLACALATGLCACLIPDGARADPPRIVGTWASRTTAERLIFKSNGYVRSCWGNGGKGNAAMGSWSQPQPGRFKVEFTHAITANCATEPTLLHPYQASISGAVNIVNAELSLFVSGEFPPDRYLRLAE